MLITSTQPSLTNLNFILDGLPFDIVLKKIKYNAKDTLISLQVCVVLLHVESGMKEVNSFTYHMLQPESMVVVV
jgi:hypothetical protein